MNMRSELHHFTLSKGEHLNVQAVYPEHFSDFRFLCPPFDPQAFHKLCDLYRDFVVPKYSFAFGTLVHFYIPEEIDLPYSSYDKTYGTIFDRTVLCNILFHKYIHLRNDRLFFDDPQVESLFRTLQERQCLRISKGKRHSLSFLPVAKSIGFLGGCKHASRLKVNANFFLMDLFDLGSIYDQLGTPFGLCVGEGKILQPPLFDREVFLVKGGQTSIGAVSLKQLTVIIDGISYRNGKNAVFLVRPEQRRSPFGGYDLVVVNERVVACKEGGNCEIPSSGFVIHLNSKIGISDPIVTYQGLEDISFAIQVGNSAIREGKPTDRFISPFYRLTEFWKASYPPSMYPHNYQADRAPRIVLGADKDEHPMLLWLEGAAKFGHDPQNDSVGASLSETAEICRKLGMYNGIHLDGGGSAQILLEDHRELMISDRHKEDLAENERAIPMALYIP